MIVTVARREASTLLARAKDVLRDAQRAVAHGADDAARDALEELRDLTRDAWVAMDRREPPESRL